MLARRDRSGHETVRPPRAMTESRREAVSSERVSRLSEIFTGRHLVLANPPGTAELGRPRNAEHARRPPASAAVSIVPPAYRAKPNAGN